MIEQHYSVARVASILGLKAQTLRGWIRAGKVSAVRVVGKTLRIPHSEIERLIADGKIEIGAKADD